MKRKIAKFIKLFFPVFVATLLSIAAVGALDEGSSPSSYTVVATVAPARYVVVNKNLQIIEIASNTKNDIRPTVLLNSIDGSEAPYSDSIRQQYLDLKPTLDFSRAGIVYQRHEHNVVTGILFSVFHAIKNFFS